MNWHPKSQVLRDDQAAKISAMLNQPLEYPYALTDNDSDLIQSRFFKDGAVMGLLQFDKQGYIKPAATKGEALVQQLLNRTAGMQMLQSLGCLDDILPDDMTVSQERENPGAGLVPLAVALGNIQRRSEGRHTINITRLLSLKNHWTSKVQLFESLIKEYVAKSENRNVQKVTIIIRATEFLAWALDENKPFDPNDAAMAALGEKQYADFQRQMELRPYEGAQRRQLLDDLHSHLCRRLPISKDKIADVAQEFKDLARDHTLQQYQHEESCATLDAIARTLGIHEGRRQEPGR